MKIHIAIVSTVLCTISLGRAEASPPPPLSSSATLVTIQQGAVWARPIDGAGLPLSGRSELLYKLPAGKASDYTLTGSRHGSMIAISYQGATGNGGWVRIMKAIPGAQVEVFKDECKPSFSPDGHCVAVADSKYGGAVSIIDLATGKARKIASSADMPFWSNDGRWIAYVAHDKTDSPDSAHVRSVSTGKEVYRSGSMNAILSVDMSPDSRFVSYNPHISRPQLGTAIEPLRGSSESVPDVDEPKYCPSVVTAWSSNNRWMLCDWKVPNPENDGEWRSDDVGLVSLHGVKRLIGHGDDAAFTPDSAHVFWRKDATTAQDPQPADLAWRAISGGPTHTLAHDVDSFAIVGP